MTKEIIDYVTRNKSIPNFHKICIRDGYEKQIITFTKFLEEVYTVVTWGQRLWHVVHNNDKVQKCECGNIAPFHKNRARFRYACCSDTCSKKKLKAVMLQLYGVENSGQSTEIRNRTKETMMKNHGVDSPLKLKSNRDAVNAGMKAAFIQKCKDELPEGYEFVSHGVHRHHSVKHALCGEISTINLYTYSVRKSKGHELCTTCNPLRKTYSVGEKQMVSFIKSVYEGEMLENYRGFLWLKQHHKFTKELDVVLPDLSIAFEFNGTYSHGDPRKYKADDEIRHVKAEKLWEHDAWKMATCKANGVTLIPIWQIDWENNQSAIKELIRSVITTHLTQASTQEPPNGIR